MIWLFLLATILLLSFISFRAKSLSFWKKHNVATLPDTHFLFGDIKRVIFAQENLADTMVRTYNMFKTQGVQYFGLYFMTKPIFVPIDPQLIRNIMVKDFNHFMDRGIQIDFEKDRLAAHLFNLSGDEWKRMRQKLSSTFTSSKLKGMMGALNYHTDLLVARIQENLQMGKSEIILNHFFKHAGIDIIGQVAFGLEMNTLNGKNHDFYKMVRRIFHPTFINLIKYLFCVGVSNPGNNIALTTLDKEMSQFFISLIKKTIEHRKQIRAQNGDLPKDLLQVLLEMHNKDQLTLDELTGQTFMFFIAPFETSSKVVNVTLYELSKNIPLQTKLRNEICKNCIHFTYDEIMQNQFLDLIFKETLRKHSTVQFIHRICCKPYKLSDNTTLEKGQVLLIPIYAVQRDSEYYPDPEFYDPLRFDEHQSVYKKVDPCTYYPFGEGPRSCIGIRFAELQVKLALCKVLCNFEVFPSNKTIEPLQFNSVTNNLLLTYKNPIYFNIKPIVK